MSYDLYVFTPMPGEAPSDTLERLDGGDLATLDPGALARNRRIAKALEALNPAYAVDELEGDTIELLDDDGIQIFLDDTHGTINFPYWDSLDADVLLARIEEAAMVIAAETGWQLYDPQLDRMIDPQTEADAFREAFGFGVGKVQEIAGKETRQKSSFFRRLFGRGS